MQKNCKICQKPFECKSNKGMYCSKACKQKAYRSTVVTIRTKGRNRYFGVIPGKYVIVTLPEGNDISKMLNLRQGTPSIIKQIKALPKSKRKDYSIKYVAIN